MSILNRRLNDPSGQPPEKRPEPPAAKPAAPSSPPPPDIGGDRYNHLSAQKLRTSGKVAYLRKMLRPKLLKSVEEADTWMRNDPDKVAVITERLKSAMEKVSAEKSEFRLSRDDWEELRTAILDDLIGYGGIQALVEDKTCSEIMVNGPDQIFAELRGKLLETAHVFDDEEHVAWTAQRIVRPLHRTLERSNPMVDARLPDGSRVHIVMPPSALQGTTISIRKFPEKRLDINDLVNNATVTPEVAEFLEACVKSRLNIVVSGGTGSGKTTLLNVLSGFIPNDERIVTIEDSAELQLAQRHVVRLETAPAMPGTTNMGILTIRDLVRGSLRMRPDRIVVGECRGGEAIDMLQAMNTGHDGSLTTVHSNNPRDCIGRLETLCLMSGVELPIYVIRRQITAAVDMIIQIARIKDGSRKIVQMTEVQGMEGEQVTLQDIFVYKQPGQRSSEPSPMGGGKLEPTGFRPNFYERLEENGFRIGGRIFGAGQNRIGERT
ncbi:MAG: CpaF family protein [Anaerolineae bacterium]|nr:CpaF family protein [Anaerolineae bacterium]NUQ06314.1 CpaF family protein [Anaerolineae bacterium]